MRSPEENFQKMVGNFDINHGEQYAISDQSNRSRKYMSTMFRMIIVAFSSCNGKFLPIYYYLVKPSPNYAWTKTSTTCLETLRTTIICNIQSIQATKVEKKANVHMCTIYAHYAYLTNYATTITSTICWETFRTTIIRNIELIRATKIEKKANVHMCTIYAHCA